MDDNFPHTFQDAQNEDILVHDMQERHQQYLDLSQGHLFIARKYSTYYYTLGTLQVVCSVIVVALSGAESIMDVADKNLQVIFALSLLTSILTAVLNFIGLESQMVMHKQTAVSYNGIAEDIVSGTIGECSIENLNRLQGMVIEKAKFISSNAPIVSLCCNPKKQNLESEWRIPPLQRQRADNTL